MLKKFQQWKQITAKKWYKVKKQKTQKFNDQIMESHSHYEQESKLIKIRWKRKT
ncbi:hypothetical protein HYE08_00705 [Mycoplasmopsis bovis]|nr:hypothetical protein [Mycoplasmopsis bovis]QQH26955.1 hypothetical protein HYE08_00705 [Mycoplasmopsis bovis]